MVVAKELGGGAQNLPADVTQLIDQLERHCLAPDGSLLSKSTFHDLKLAREEMTKERQRYLEASAVYTEAIGMVEECQQALSVVRIGGIRDVQGHYPQIGLKAPPQVYEALEHRMAVAEAAQRLRLPLISKDGELQDDEIDRWSTPSRSSLDSTSTSVTMSSNLTNLYTSGMAAAGNSAPSTDASEPFIGGVPNQYLGITPSYLWQSQLLQSPLCMDMTEYQILLSREIGSRLDAKCDKLADVIALDDIDPSITNQIPTARLPERVKVKIEEIEREEATLCEDLYSSDRKFAEYYNVLEQILVVLIKLVKDIKLQHQHKYDELQKTWLSKRCDTMSAKLRVLEHILLLETYTPDTIPALHKIRKYLSESTEEATLAHNKAITRLREYQGVDPHFDMIARQYHDIVKKLEGMRWTIQQVEMDLKRMPAPHPST
ncbi:unnamed protein product [Cuscuta campestris]|uniref:Uncharacterized protein n=1 Tax=Cuscuta campestris TaxID=132261 RepID=A0A484LXR7_9ASTE|nr:unnamed protein product [Cuscuta campestris]